MFAQILARLGEVEDERYLWIALYQGVPKVKKKVTGTTFAMGKEVIATHSADPTLVACALNRSRFYLFSQREPLDADDATQVSSRLDESGLLVHASFCAASGRRQ